MIKKIRLKVLAVLSLIVVIIFSSSQFFLIILGWQAAIDIICLAFPNHPTWFELRSIRGAGIFVALICILYPVYFGLFGLGFQLRHEKDEGQVKKTNANVAG